MNKYLILSAAALLSSVRAVDAGTYCVMFNTFGGGSYCDSGKIFTGVDAGAFGNSLRAWQHINNDCEGHVSDGYGIVGKTKGLGDVSFMSDNILAQDYGIFSESLSWTFPKKIKNGGTWAVWVGLSGTTSFEDGSGPLQIVKCDAAPNQKRGGKSTLALVKALIEHRNAKATSQ